jgi:hypothetical protein
MRRLILLSSLVTLVLPTAADARARHTATHVRAPRALLLNCDRTRQAAVFEGQMNAMPSAARLQMRFRLQVSTPDQPGWTTVRAAGFSAWHTSDAGRRRYVYTKRVQALPAPGAYRMRVRFRWLDATGAVVRSTKLTSRTCKMPDPRADLRVTAIDIAPGANPASQRYAITVRNAGRRTADASDLRLELPDGTAIVGLVGGLVPGQQETLVLRGPACAPAAMVTATADATDSIDESDEANSLSVPCPGAATARASRRR